MAIGLPARPSENSSINAANFSARGIVALFGRDELWIANPLSDQDRRHCFGRSKVPTVMIPHSPLARGFRTVRRQQSTERRSMPAVDDGHERSLCRIGRPRHYDVDRQ
jgi:hypothetical protein